jgi:hypothetical protein
MNDGLKLTEATDPETCEVGQFVRQGPIVGLGSKWKPGYDYKLLVSSFGSPEPTAMEKEFVCSCIVEEWIFRAARYSSAGADFPIWIREK